jgi:hypothetical protein
MPYRIGMTIAILIAAGRFGREKQERAAPLTLVSCGRSFVQPAIAGFPASETWTGIKESSNG